MRITNSMMANRMMLNINRNAENVNMLYNRWSSAKQIQYPSENPIIASRVLKFKTTLAENEQYQKNISQGMSWMEVTENGFSQCVDILNTIKELVTQGDGAETFEDKQKIATQIQSLTEELGLSMNRSYTGRYLFSGYRTDEPGTMISDLPALTYTSITQDFIRNDMEKTTALENDGGTSFKAVDVTIFKLAYTGITDESLNLTFKDADNNTVTTYNSVISKKSDEAGAYSPKPYEVYYIEDTGELVLGENYAELDFASLQVTYDKTGFEKGDLNPKVYFTCTDAYGDTFTMDRQVIEYEFGVGTRVAVNSLAGNIVTDKLYADLSVFCDVVLSVGVSNLEDVVARMKADDPNLSDGEAREKALTFIDQERQTVETMLQSRFSNMLTLVERHSSTLSVSHTDLGTRMNRLDMIQVRLELDEESYTKLLSENEDADMIETAMNLSNAESTYQASMQVGMSIIQTSLVNFL